MRHIKELILIIFVISVCPSCLLVIRHNFYNENQSARFSNDYTPLVKDKLNIDGYYYNEDTNDQFAFYPDGTFICFDLKNKDTDYRGKSVNDLDSLTLIPKKGFSSDCGIFKIEGDTLIVDTYFRQLGLTWYLTSYRLEIIDKSTLRLYKIMHFSKMGGGNYYSEANMLYHFVKASPLPSPFEVNVKKQKWMWDNKKDWKAYKQELQEYLDSKVTQNNTDE